jgi:hypothetical protein
MKSVITAKNPCSNFGLALSRTAAKYCRKSWLSPAPPQVMHLIIGYGVCAPAAAASRITPDRSFGYGAMPPPS